MNRTFTLQFTIFTIALLVIIFLKYFVNLKPNIKVGTPLLLFGIAITFLGIYFGNVNMSLAGFLVFVFSLLFFPTRRRRYL